MYAPGKKDGEEDDEADEPQPMWDEEYYDDSGKVLKAIAQVERNEEDKARRERSARDQLEIQELGRLAGTLQLC